MKKDKLQSKLKLKIFYIESEYINLNKYKVKNNQKIVYGRSYSITCAWK